jgi:hypothetical protein
MGSAFFLQIPSVNKWSNDNALFRPMGFIPFGGIQLLYFIRIYTTLSGIGQIQIDNVSISALLYRRISSTDYYFYEVQTTNNTHSISSNVNYTVCCCYTILFVE